MQQGSLFIRKDDLVECLEERLNAVEKIAGRSQRGLQSSYLTSHNNRQQRQGENAWS